MNYYGYGVNLKDVRSAMEMSQLAYSYYNSVMDSYRALRQRPRGILLRA